MRWAKGAVSSFRKGCLVRGVMAGKKSKGETKAQGRRGASSLQSGGPDDIARRLPGMRTQDELSLQQVTLLHLLSPLSNVLMAHHSTGSSQICNVALGL